MTKTGTVLQIAASLGAGRGGPTTAALGLFLALRNQLDTSLLTTDAHLEAEETPALEAAGVEIFSTSGPANQEFSWSLLWTVKRRLPNTDFIVLHGLWLPQTMAVVALARAKRVPYAIQLHGGLEPYQFQSSRAKKRLAAFAARAALRSAHFVACATLDEAEKARLYEPTATYLLTGIGVDPVECAPRDVGDRWRVGYIGRYASKKRLDLVVAAVKEMERAGAVQLICAGGADPGDHDFMRGLADDAGLQRLEQRGQVSGLDKEQFWADIDLLVLPSDNENFAIVVGEALAHAVPVVVSKNVALQQFVQDTGGGLVADQDPIAIAEAMLRILEPESYRRYSRAALAAAEQLQWPHVAAVWLKAMKDPRPR